MYTTTNKHWAIDNPFTDNKIDLQEQFVSDTIKGKKDERINQIAKNICEKELIDNKPNFDIPNFETKYSINHSKNYFTKTQKWVGHIIELSSNSFKAKLEDLIKPGTFEIAEFSFDEVSPEDKVFLVEGGIFYWAIGTAMNNGQITKESIIRFQRVIAWTELDYDSSEDRANDLFNNLNWD